MPTRPGPTVQRRRLGIELRRLREAAGKTIDEVAHVLECSDSKVSRIENGQVSTSPRDVRDMLDFYGVEGERREELVEYARSARKKGWWEAYSDTLLVPLVGLEVAADRILAYESRAVHGLLQTQDYARALIRAVQPDLAEDQVRRRVELRMIRQELLHGEESPEFHLVIEECALRRPVGGRSVLEAQLQYLEQAVASTPSLSLQILPLAVGEHAAMDGPFTVYQFSAATDPDVVYFEHARANMYLEDPEDVESYSNAFDRIRIEALTPDESSLLLPRLVGELQRSSKIRRCPLDFASVTGLPARAVPERRSQRPLRSRSPPIMTDLSNLVWRKSSSCSGGTCVEVALVDRQVLVRDSKSKSGAILSFQQAEWLAFLEGARRGEFNFASNLPRR